VAAKGTSGVPAIGSSTGRTTDGLDGDRTLDPPDQDATPGNSRYNSRNYGTYRSNTQSQRTHTRYGMCRRG
jgi:hypothetical protein